MRTMIAGSGLDVTSTVVPLLKAAKTLREAFLIQIGEPQDSFCVRITDWEAPLTHAMYGTFLPGAVIVGETNAAIGFDDETLDIEWSPKNRVITQSRQTASPLQLAAAGVYSEAPVKVWKTLMPTPGDANTWGAYEEFAGWVGDTSVDRKSIKFTIESFMKPMEQMVPSNLIELTAPLANYTGAVPPKGLSVIPHFTVISGSTPTELILDCISPTAHQIFSNALFYQGFVAFNTAGSTLEGAISMIRDNGLVTVLGVNYNVVYLFNALDWAPAPGDVVEISGSAPITSADGSAVFRFVPNPQMALHG